jgi:hypothetical protein
LTTDDGPDHHAVAEERRRVRELRTSVDLACAVLRQGHLSREEAEELVAATRRRALILFPEKGDVFDLVLAPRLRRILDEVLPAPPPARVLPSRRGRDSQAPTHTKSRITPPSSKKTK